MYDMQFFLHSKWKNEKYGSIQKRYISAHEMPWISQCVGTVTIWFFFRELAFFICHKLCVTHFGWIIVSHRYTEDDFFSPEMTHFMATASSQFNFTATPHSQNRPLNCFSHLPIMFSFGICFCDARCDVALFAALPKITFRNSPKIDRSIATRANAFGSSSNQLDTFVRFIFDV